MKLAASMARLGTESAFEVLAKARALEAKGKNIVHLEIGQPDFPTPEHVREAGKKAIDDGWTGYGPTAGFPDFREAIAEYISKTRNISVSGTNVVVVPGGKPIMYFGMMAVLEPGDEVIYPNPGFPIYESVINYLGATAVPMPLIESRGFSFDLDEFERKLSPRTKMVVLNSPANPTGGLISEETVRQIGAAAAAKGIWTIVDLCYEQLIYEPVPHNLPKALFDTNRDHTILCGSASKAYAMTGWRCGWTIAPKELTSVFNTIEGQTTSNITSVTQKAALAALTGSQEPVKAMLDEYRRRRDSIHEWLTAHPGIKCVKPSGAFYLFPDISGLLTPDGVKTSFEFSQRLLEKEFVVVTPGEAFEAPGYLRISYATSMEQLREGATRILRFAESIQTAKAGA